MTEQEARQKWCPFVRLASNKDMSWDNRGNDSHNPECIASDCMAWRWSVTPALEKSENARGNTLAKADGRCGLAGKP